MQQSRYFDRYFQIELSEDDVSERKIENALRDLFSGDTSSDDVSYLKETVFDDDREKAELAIIIASDLRADTLEASTAILRFVSEIHSSLEYEQARYSARLPRVDRWLSREIFVVLQERLMTPADMVSCFGYARLAASAYAITRSPRLEHNLVKPLYRPIAEEWIRSVRAESLVETLARPALLQMTNFFIWFKDAHTYGGFLSDRIKTAEELIDVAVAFVSYTKWVGAGVQYDAVFRGEEFSFAVSDEAASSFLLEAPKDGNIPQYESTDLPERQLTAEQVRDFATRSVRALYTSMTDAGSVW